jgi:hypothetical protein
MKVFERSGAERSDKFGISSGFELFRDEPVRFRPIIAADIQWILGKDTSQSVVPNPVLNDLKRLENASGKLAFGAIEDPDELSRHDWFPMPMRNVDRHEE